MRLIGHGCLLFADREGVKTMQKRCASKEKAAGKKTVRSYRLKCAKTANGLSHFVMYGDAPKEKMLV